MQNEGGAAVGCTALRVIEVCLQLRVGSLRVMLPASQQVGAREMQVRRSRLVLQGLVGIPLHGEGVGGAWPVHAKTALRLPPAVAGARAIGELESVLAIS